MGTTILSLHTSTGQMPAHAALQTVMEVAGNEALPSAAWELLVELIQNVYEHAGTRGVTDTPWGVEIVPGGDTVELRVFDAGVGIERERLPSLFNEPQAATARHRGKGLMSLRQHAKSGAVKDVKVSSDGLTVMLTGSYAMVTRVRDTRPGVDVTATCRRDRLQ